MDERGKQPENTQGAGGLTVKSSPEIIIIIIIRQVRLLQCLLSRHNFNIHTMFFHSVSRHVVYVVQQRILQHTPLLLPQ